MSVANVVGGICWWCSAVEGVALLTLLFTCSVQSFCSNDRGVQIWGHHSQGVVGKDCSSFASGWWSLSRRSFPVLTSTLMMLLGCWIDNFFCSALKNSDDIPPTILQLSYIKKPTAGRCVLTLSMVTQPCRFLRMFLQNHLFLPSRKC